MAETKQDEQIKIVTEKGLGIGWAFSFVGLPSRRRERSHLLSCARAENSQKQAVSLVLVFDINLTSTLALRQLIATV